MNPIQQVLARRQAVVRQMLAIGSMQRGSISEQYLWVRHKGRAEPVRCGPYYVLSKRQEGKTVSRRLTSPEALEEARRDVAAHRRFVALCKQFEALTEQLGQLERDAQQAAPEKKRSRPRPGRRPRRPRSNRAPK